MLNYMCVCFVFVFIPILSSYNKLCAIYNHHYSFLELFDKLSILRELLLFTKT